MILWNALLNLDDLSSSTGAVMELLCTLMSCKESLGHHFSDRDFVELIPRLYPFLSHNISSVRASCLFTLRKLIELGCSRSDSDSDSGQTVSQRGWLGPLLQSLLCQLFQHLIVEGKEEIVQTAQQVSHH